MLARPNNIKPRQAIWKYIEYIQPQSNHKQQVRYLPTRHVNGKGSVIVLGQDGFLGGIPLHQQSDDFDVFARTRRMERQVAPLVLVHQRRTARILVEQPPNNLQGRVGIAGQMEGQSLRVTTRANTTGGMTAAMFPMMIGPKNGPFQSLVGVLGGNQEELGELFVDAEFQLVFERQRPDLFQLVVQRGSQGTSLVFDGHFLGGEFFGSGGGGGWIGCHILY